jgi:hypothetical protein
MVRIEVRLVAPDLEVSIDGMDFDKLAFDSVSFNQGLIGSPVPAIYVWICPMLITMELDDQIAIPKEAVEAKAISRERVDELVRLPLGFVDCSQNLRDCLQANGLSYTMVEGG